MLIKMQETTITWAKLLIINVFNFLSGSKEDTTTLHVLCLLKELMGTFPLGAVKSCCETLLRVMTLSHVVRMPKYFQVQPGKFRCPVLKIFFKAMFLLHFVAAAGDGQRHAGISQAVQRKTEPLVPFSRTQRTDHHGEKPQKQQMCFNSSGILCKHSPIICRRCMITLPVRTTCSHCWPGLLSWRKLTFTWRGIMTTLQQI